MSNFIEDEDWIIYDHEVPFRDQLIENDMYTPDTESNDKVAEDMRIQIQYEYIMQSSS